ncbi:MAG: hypothetical protein ACTII7_09685 [Galactobacter sp.]
MASERANLNDLMNSAPVDRTAGLRKRTAAKSAAPRTAEPKSAVKREHEYNDRRGHTLSPNIDHATFELLQAYRNANACSAVVVLAEALADASVQERLSQAWPNSPGIPGLSPARRTRRRSPDHKTHQVYLELGLQGRASVEEQAKEVGAPSLSAFVSKALNLYLSGSVSVESDETV